MTTGIETRVVRDPRKCGHCPTGFVEFGRDEYNRRTGVCINCGRENIQRVMSAKAVETQCGVNGGRR